jgi:hypothetical protein
MFLSTSTNLTQQIVTYLQHELRDLDKCLLKYNSPIYNELLFLKKVIKKTGFTEVIKNSKHPLFDKWYDLVSRCFDKNEAYSTTRLAFPGVASVGRVLKFSVQGTSMHGFRLHTLVTCYLGLCLFSRQKHRDSSS